MYKINHNMVPSYHTDIYFLVIDYLNLIVLPGNIKIITFLSVDLIFTNRLSY